MPAMMHPAEAVFQADFRLREKVFQLFRQAAGAIRPQASAPREEGTRKTAKPR
jgi:hypothetical protein